MHDIEGESYAAQEAARRGKDLYERAILRQVEPEHDGRFLAFLTSMATTTR